MPKTGQWDAILLIGGHHFILFMLPIIDRPAVVLEHRDSSLAMSALGGCVWYLKRMLLDQELLGMKNFVAYDPFGLTTEAASHLVLDGQTLSNLEVLETQEGTRAGSLLDYMDSCTTAFGSRTLKQWLSQPLFRVDDINARLDAVEDLMREVDIVNSIRAQLKVCVR